MRQPSTILLLSILLIPVVSRAREQKVSDSDLVVRGTINVALGNKNGLVVLTDSRVTSGDGRQLTDPAQKLFILDDQTICAIAGFGWALSPEVPDLETRSAAIIYEYARQSAAQPQLQYVAEKLRALAGLFNTNLSMIANVLNSTGHPLPLDTFAFQLIVAGYDPDGKPRIGKINSRSTVSERGLFWSSVDEGNVSDVEDELVQELNGVRDVADAILSEPESWPQDSTLAQYAASLRANQGKSLTVAQMTALAERLAFYTAHAHREVGGPNQVAVITAPHTMRVTQPQFPRPPKPALQFSLVVGSSFAYSGVGFRSRHTVFVRTSWTGMAPEIGDNFFIANTFDHCTLTYHGGVVNLGPTNRIENSMLLVAPLIRPDDESVYRLAQTFRWSGILRDFSTGAVPF